LGSLSAQRLRVSLCWFHARRQRGVALRKPSSKVVHGWGVSNLAAAGQRQSYKMFIAMLGAYPGRFLVISAWCCLEMLCVVAVSLGSLKLHGLRESGVAIITTFNWRPGLSPLPVKIAKSFCDCLQKSHIGHFLSKLFLLGQAIACACSRITLFLRCFIILFHFLLLPSREVAVEERCCGGGAGNDFLGQGRQAHDRTKKSRK